MINTSGITKMVEQSRPIIILFLVSAMRNFNAKRDKPEGLALITIPKAYVAFT